MLKIREAKTSEGNNPIDGDVHEEEFVLGGKDEGNRKELCRQEKEGDHDCSID